MVGYDRVITFQQNILANPSNAAEKSLVERGFIIGIKNIMYSCWY
jgi:uncharacterized membrane protein (DUF485 family)